MEQYFNTYISSPLKGEDKGEGEESVISLHLTRFEY